MFTLTVENTDQNTRIDKLLMPYFTTISRSKFQDHIKQGLVLVNGQPIKANYKVKEDDLITVDEFNAKEVVLSVEAQNIPLDIVFEDEYIIVINKPKRMVTHPAPNNYTDTLVNALLYHTKDLSDVNGELRRGIVHRLDQDTTGLILICKTNEVHESMSEALKKREVKRYYKALVVGEMREDYGSIEAPIGRGKHDRMKMYVTSTNSKPACTHFKVMDRYDGYTLIECELDTGRTHQIRVHLNYIGFPVYGDPLYGNKRDIQPLGQFLHAYKLAFEHPITKEMMSFEKELPEYFQNKLQALTLRSE